MSAQDVRGGGRLRSDLVSSVPPSSEVAGPPRTPSEARAPVDSLRGEQTGAASVIDCYCDICFRPGKCEWGHRCKAHRSTRPLCDFCGLYPAEIIDWNGTEDLGISPDTVKTHVQNILEGLGAHNRAHALGIAVRTGLLSVA